VLYPLSYGRVDGSLAPTSAIIRVPDRLHTVLL
jgi:hypothetical protein